MDPPQEYDPDYAANYYASYQDDINQMPWATEQEINKFQLAAPDADEEAFAYEIPYDIQVIEDQEYPGQETTIGRRRQRNEYETYRTELVGPMAGLQIHYDPNIELTPNWQRPFLTMEEMDATGGRALRPTGLTYEEAAYERDLSARKRILGNWKSNRPFKAPRKQRGRRHYYYY